MIDRVLGGDPSGFEGLVRRWQRPLVNLAFRFCPRPRSGRRDGAGSVSAGLSLAGDVARRDAAFSTWLFAIATNVSMLPSSGAFRRGPSLSMTFRSLRSPVRRCATMRIAIASSGRAVLALPTKYREALMLFYFHDMDVSAAAQSLSLPEGTIKARLSRGRAILLRKLSTLLAQPGTQPQQEQER